MGLAATQRFAYRIAEVCALAGVSRWTVLQAIERGEIATKHVGRTLLLNARDVERIFGFPSESEESEESKIPPKIVRRARKMVG